VVKLTKKIIICRHGLENVHSTWSAMIDSIIAVATGLFKRAFIPMTLLVREQQT